MDKLITVLTATYNRANLLPDLYASLCRQSNQNFNWIIIDDGSSDDTKTIVEKWLMEKHPFTITYHYIPNGGKNRAVNHGVKHVQTPFTMIVDSDDYLTDDAIEFLSEKAKDIINHEKTAGISGLKGHNETTPLKPIRINNTPYIVANNLERKQYGLERDACEVYKTCILLQHPFEVWKNEKFVPEEIVWNQIALEGYNLRWYNKITYIARYQENGLTKDSFNLIKKNPMGYAMMYKQRILLSNNFKNKFYNATQMIAYSIIGKSFNYIYKENKDKVITSLALPMGLILSIRRRIQFTTI